MGYQWSHEDKAKPADKPQDKDAQPRAEDEQNAPAGPERDGSSTPGYPWDDRHEAREAEQERRDAKDRFDAGEGSKAVNGERLAGTRVATSAAATADAANQRIEQQKKERRSAEDRMLLAMLDSPFDNYFGDMDDAEFDRYVDAVEAATGMAYEDYARDVLGDDMPERRAGESDRDYKRRLADDVREKVMDEDGHVRPGRFRRRIGRGAGPDALKSRERSDQRAYPATPRRCPEPPGRRARTGRPPWRQPARRAGGI